MKRASYRHAIDWVAWNDDPETLEAEDIRGYISTLLVADLFGVEPERVALDIAEKREELGR